MELSKIYDSYVRGLWPVDSSSRFAVLPAAFPFRRRIACQPMHFDRRPTPGIPLISTTMPEPAYAHHRWYRWQGRRILRCTNKTNRKTNRCEKIARYQASKQVGKCQRCRSWIDGECRSQYLFIKVQASRRIGWPPLSATYAPRRGNRTKCEFLRLTYFRTILVSQRVSALVN